MDSPSNHKEHCKPKPYTPEVGEQQPAHDPPDLRGTALLRRIPFCYSLAALAFVFISSSSAVGLYYSIAQNAMGDGFTTAGFILAVGTLIVTPPAAYHYQHGRCWTKDSKSACPEGRFSLRMLVFLLSDLTSFARFSQNTMSQRICPARLGN